MSESRVPYNDRYPRPIPAATWRPLLEEERTAHADTGELHVAPNDLILDQPIALGRNDKHFLAWSDIRVYFPIRWKGDPFVSSAPRNPQAEGEEPIDLT